MRKTRLRALIAWDFREQIDVGWLNQAIAYVSKTAEGNVVFSDVNTRDDQYAIIAHDEFDRLSAKRLDALYTSIFEDRPPKNLLILPRETVEETIDGETD